MIKKVIISFLSIVLIVTCMPIINITNMDINISNAEDISFVDFIKVNLYDKDGYNLSENDKYINFGYIKINGDEEYSYYAFVKDGIYINLIVNIPTPIFIHSLSIEAYDSEDAYNSNGKMTHYGFGSDDGSYSIRVDNFESYEMIYEEACTVIDSHTYQGGSMVYRIYDTCGAIGNGQIEIDVFLDTTDTNVYPKNQYREDTPEYKEVLINHINTYARWDNIKVSAKSDSESKNTLSVVSGKDSTKSSITLGDLKSVLARDNINISSLTNSNNETLNLKDDDLIGTGTKIKLSNNMEFTIVVYGDSTGDGAIDALDMKDGIDSFLGTAELTDIKNESLDLKKDGEINALDLSQMVKSYLGTLNGDILQES